MSHICKVKVKVKNLAALKKVGKKLGMELVAQKQYQWYGRYMRDWPLPDGIKEADLGKCDYVLKIPNNPNAYEVGVRKMPDGSYTLLYDFWGGGYGLEERIGQQGSKLLQGYSEQIIQEQLEQEAFMVSERKVLADGRIMVRAVR